VSQQHGVYAYNPASAIAMAEGAKFAMAFAAHCRTKAPGAPPLPRAPLSVLGSYLLLAAAYCANNQLTFVILRVADPGTLTLAKSSTPLLTALLQWAGFGTPINGLQWACIVIQMCALAVVLHEPCACVDGGGGGGGGGGGAAQCGGGYPPSTFATMAVACLISAGTSAFNARLLQKGETSMAVQNCLLYGFGFAFNVAAFAARLAPSAQTGFFAGYGTPSAVLLVVANALMGLAVNAVYKYGGAIVKTFSSSVSSAVLLYVSSVLFGLRLDVAKCAGSLIVFSVAYLYFNYALTWEGAKGGEVATGAPQGSVGARRAMLVALGAAFAGALGAAAGAGVGLERFLEPAPGR